MKIAIISDIHANLAALTAVLDAVEQEKCTKILCGGDIVGYGPHPLECLEIIRDRKIPAVRGNHDHMMVNDDRDCRLRAEVQESIRWTRDVLPQDAKEWVGTLPVTLQYAGIEVVHASHVITPEWHYVVDPRAVMANFLFQSTAISFNGHTHLPAIALHQHGHTPKLIMFRDMVLPKNHRFLINVGSVGQPRDRNPDAAFTIFETRDRSIALRRIPYDVERTQAAIRKAGLPERLATRLAEGR